MERGCYNCGGCSVPCGGDYNISSVASKYDADNDSKLDLLITLPLAKKLAVLFGKQYTGKLTCP